MHIMRCPLISCHLSAAAQHQPAYQDNYSAATNSDSSPTEDAKRCQNIYPSKQLLSAVYTTRPSHNLQSVDQSILDFRNDMTTDRPPLSAATVVSLTWNDFLGLYFNVKLYIMYHLFIISLLDQICIQAQYNEQHLLNRYSSLVVVQWLFFILEFILILDHIESKLWSTFDFFSGIFRIRDYLIDFYQIFLYR